MQNAVRKTMVFAYVVKTSSDEDQIGPGLENENRKPEGLETGRSASTFVLGGQKIMIHYLSSVFLGVI